MSHGELHFRSRTFVLCHQHTKRTVAGPTTSHRAPSLVTHAAIQRCWQGLEEVGTSGVYIGAAFVWTRHQTPSYQLDRSDPPDHVEIVLSPIDRNILISYADSSTTTDAIDNTAIPPIQRSPGILWTRSTREAECWRTKKKEHDKKKVMRLADLNEERALGDADGPCGITGVGRRRRDRGKYKRRLSVDPVRAGSPSSHRSAIEPLRPNVYSTRHLIYCCM